MKAKIPFREEAKKGALAITTRAAATLETASLAAAFGIRLTSLIDVKETPATLTLRVII